jgi:hypothetical protein
VTIVAAVHHSAGVGASGWRGEGVVAGLGVDMRWILKRKEIAFAPLCTGSKHKANALR